ncbi:MAG: DUF1320 domain-containing protein [Thermodesulfobacteriota bacterium]
MSYCTTDDLIKVLPEADLIRLTDDADSGTLDTAKAQEAIDRADQEINAYIGGQVKLPISGTTPAILAKLSADLAVYNLYSRVMSEIPETWRERRKAAVRLLEQFAEGKITLGVQPAPTAPSSYPRGVQTETRDQIFTSTELDKY